MTLQPFFAATLVIQVHVLAATLALLVGLGQFALGRGSRTHRISGWLWVVLMAATAMSSFFIHEIRLVGLWSPIHLLSILTLISLVLGIRAIRRRDIKMHRYTMTALFSFALVGAGIFTLLPGRMMSSLVSGG